MTTGFIIGIEDILNLILDCGVLKNYLFHWNGSIVCYNGYILTFIPEISVFITSWNLMIEVYRFAAVLTRLSCVYNINVHLLHHVTRKLVWWVLGNHPTNFPLMMWTLTSDASKLVWWTHQIPKTLQQQFMILIYVNLKGWIWIYCHYKERTRSFRSKNKDTTKH